MSVRVIFCSGWWERLMSRQPVAEQKSHMGLFIRTSGWRERA